MLVRRLVASYQRRKKERLALGIREELPAPRVQLGIGSVFSLNGTTFASIVTRDRGRDLQRRDGFLY